MNMEDYEQTLMCSRYKDKKDKERLNLLENLLVRTKIQSFDLGKEIKKLKKIIGEKNV